ncbi:MAG: hypothetical protein KL863_27750 [Rhizobium sp.]|nr:hypothetical protein [Rhizobium sp.]
MVSPIDSTLRAVARHGLILEVTCDRCGHQALFDPGWLSQKMNPLTDIKRVPFRCQCGSKTIKVTAYPDDWLRRQREAEKEIRRQKSD